MWLSAFVHLAYMSFGFWAGGYNHLHSHVGYLPDSWPGAVIGAIVGSWAARSMMDALGCAFSGKAPTPPSQPTAPARSEAAAKVSAKPKPPTRSEALTLLAALQREARFVDFIQEPLAGYSDAQVGAVVRDVHRDCAAVLKRMFALRPAVNDEEGKDVSVPADFDSNRWRLTGNVTGAPPFRGRLVHPGWEATACELPTWSGSAASARVVAPAEVELK